MKNHMNLVSSFGVLVAGCLMSTSAFSASFVNQPFGISGMTSGSDLVQSAQSQPDTMLLAQQNQNTNQNQNQNQNTNTNQNQNQNQNATESDEGGADTPEEEISEAAESRPVNACFFVDPDFAGESFCAGAGDYSRSMSEAWNDRISSIRITGAPELTICTDSNYEGQCMSVQMSVNQLDGTYDNAVSSWKIEE